MLAVSPGRARVVALALGVGTVSLVGTHFAALNQPGMRPLDALGIALLLVGPAALLVRRRWPVAVLATAVAAMVIYRGLGYPLGRYIWPVSWHWSPPSSWATGGPRSR